MGAAGEVLEDLIGPSERRPPPHDQQRVVRRRVRRPLGLQHQCRNQHGGPVRRGVPVRHLHHSKPSNTRHRRRAPVRTVGTPCPTRQAWTRATHVRYATEYIDSALHPCCLENCEERARFGPFVTRSGLTLLAGPCRSPAGRSCSTSGEPAVEIAPPERAYESVLRRQSGVAPL
jgi:hypothetical protein